MTWDALQIHAYICLTFFDCSDKDQEVDLREGPPDSAASLEAGEEGRVMSIIQSVNNKSIDLTNR